MITKIAGIYAERLMSDVLLVVGDQAIIYSDSFTNPFIPVLLYALIINFGVDVNFNGDLFWLIF